MGAVKIKQADKWFSKCVRARANWCCERCGTQHDKSSQGLHCSHYHGRGRWAVRFDPENAEALCYGCHSLMGSLPVEHTKRIQEKLGQYRFNALRERSNDLKRGRDAKRDEKEISKHFKAEYERMEKMRECGDVGRIEFEGYL